MDRVIPDNLKQYREDILAGLALANRRLQEAKFAGYLHNERVSRPKSPGFPPPRPPVELIEPERPPVKKVLKVKIWPLMLLRAKRLKRAGGCLLWFFARSIDPKGSGVVTRSDLEKFTRGLGLSKRQYRRYAAQAKKYKFMKEIHRKSGPAYILAGAERVALNLECEQIGNRTARLPAEKLIKAGWIAWVWACFISTLNGRPISRAKLREITNIPEQTQRYYEEKAGVSSTANYAVSDKSSDNLQGLLDHGRGGAFVFQDKNTKGPVIAWRLPNSYSAPGIAESMSKGRSRKIQKTLNASSFIVERGPGASVRIFNDTCRSAESAAKKLVKVVDPWEPAEVYKRRYSRGIAKTWSPVPVHAND